MPTWIKRILTPPVFEGDPDKTRTARLLNTILWSALTVAVLAACLLPLVAKPLTGVVVVSTWVLITLSSLLLLRFGHVQFAGGLLSLAIWIFSTIMIVLSGGIGRSPAASYVTITILASLLLGRRAAVGVAGLSIAAGLGMLYAEMNGLLPTPTVYVAPVGRFIGLIVNISMSGVLLYLAVGGIAEALAQAQGQADELAEQRERLEETVEARTQDLTRRTRYLEATAAIARDTASVLALQEQLVRVVNLVSEQFGLYHTGIFLLDPNKEWAVLQAASSEGGQRMLTRDHRLRLGVGIVGYAVEHGEPRIALDVGRDAVFFDNPDLPSTRSEVALPLRARGEVIGALDVQSTEPEAFDDEDVAVLQTLADQVAVAISNARLFEQAQESLEAERRAYGELSRVAWQKLLRSESGLGYLSQRQDTVPAGDLWRAEMKTALDRGQTALGDEDSRAVAIPIKMRDQVIGVIDGRKPAGTSGWAPEEVQLLETLTEQLAVALEGARLYQDTQRRAAQEQLLGEVTARMRETLDIDTVLQTAVWEIGEALGIAEVEVRLAEPAQAPGPTSPAGGDNGSEGGGL